MFNWFYNRTMFYISFRWGKFELYFLCPKCWLEILCTVDVMMPGTSIIIRNAKIDMWGLRLINDKWSRLEVTEPVNKIESLKIVTFLLWNMSWWLLLIPTEYMKLADVCRSTSWNEMSTGAGCNIKMWSWSYWLVFLNSTFLIFDSHSSPHTGLVDMPNFLVNLNIWFCYRFKLFKTT